MDGFELEIHNHDGPPGTVRIRQEHSGVTRVIVHVYQNWVEIIECGGDDDGSPSATHILGRPPQESDYEIPVSGLRQPY